MKISNIRLLNQQLLSPLFSQPKELVSWMGSHTGTELFHGKVGSRNAFEVGNDSDCGESTTRG